MTTLEKIKLAIRISHSKLDDDLQADIDACIADLRLCGVLYGEESDPLIFNAIKLYCRALYTDDIPKASEYMRRYESLKACLIVAEGYGWRDSDE